MSEPADLERGRELFRERAWAEAHRALRRADEAQPLGATDLETLATAAYLVGRDAEYLKTLERAHQAHLESGDELRAARCAFWIGLRLSFRGETGGATGWYGRAQRLLDRSARESPEVGYLRARSVEDCLATGDCERAFDAAEGVAEVGERFGDLDLVAIARLQQGRARLGQERVPEGLSLLDELMVLVGAGRLSPIVTGLMYCAAVDNCRRVYALDRAREWTASLSAWCQEQPEMVAFSGICRVHRSEVLQISGDWQDAVDEARRAFERARAIDPFAAGAAAYQLGELHRLRGELSEAEALYKSASQQGFEPLPGIALLRLSQGRTGSALASVRRALELATAAFRRLRLLPACVEISLAAGDLDQARVACEELEELARKLDVDAVRGMALHCRGELELAAGRADAAASALSDAVEVLTAVGVPYDVARARLSQGLACRALGDEDCGRLELEAARLVFERLGARLDLERVERLDGKGSEARAHGLTAREREVLRCVASGMTNKQIAGCLSVSERTIDRHVSNIFGKLGVSSRAAATASAYEHRLL